MEFKELRRKACNDLSSGKISIEDYNNIFKTITYANLSYNGSHFFTMTESINAIEISSIYSRAKHGSLEDINYLADKVASLFISQFDDNESSIYQLFQTLEVDLDILVLIVPGSRNIESSSNIIFDHALLKINLFLTRNHFPTIINVKLPRLDPPVENYASLSQEEREEISKVRDHILPDSNFYSGRNIHLFFGDDVLITGSTADKVISSALSKGVKSFHSIYTLVIDPMLVNRMPEVEYILNTTCLKGGICDEFILKVCTEDIVPVIKTYNILLNKANFEDLKIFISRIPIGALDTLYLYAMNNGYNKNRDYCDSLYFIENYLSSNNESSFYLL